MLNTHETLQMMIMVMMMMIDSTMCTISIHHLSIAIICCALKPTNQIKQLEKRGAHFFWLSQFNEYSWIYMGIEHVILASNYTSFYARNCPNRLHKWNNSHKVYVWKSRKKTSTSMIKRLSKANDGAKRDRGEKK